MSTTFNFYGVTPQELARSIPHAELSRNPDGEGKRGGWFLRWTSHDGTRRGVELTEPMYHCPTCSKLWEDAPLPKEKIHLRVDPIYEKGVGNGQDELAKFAELAGIQYSHTD